MIDVGSVFVHGIKRRALASLALLSMLLLAGAGQADNRVQFSTGFIAAVGIEVDENGHPMLAEYDAKGFFVSDVGYLGLGDLADVTLYRASDWRAYEELHRNLQADNPERTRGATLMSAEQYRGRTFRTRDGRSRLISKPPLRDDTRSVYVIAEDRMFLQAPSKDSFIIAEYPIALHQNAGLAADDVTLLLNDKGEIVRSSKYDVSVKAAIYKEEGRRSNDGFERLWQPIAGAAVSAGDAELNQFPGGRAVSLEDGRYSMTYVLPPCPGFSYSLDVPIIATLNIENFNPKAEDQGFLSALRSDPKVCVGFGDVSLGSSLAAVSAQLNARAIVASLATPIYNVDVTFSTMQLNGLARISDVALAGQTAYIEENVRIDRLEQDEYRFDFNLDGEDDIVRRSLGDFDKVDVWISPNQPEDELGNPVPADFSRLADYQLINQLEPQGLLGEISQADLENTDVYVFRRSTGQLIGSIESLTERQPRDSTVLVPGSPNPEGRATYRGVHTDEEIATFGFTAFLVGAVSNDTISKLRFDENRVENGRRPTRPSDGSAGGFASDRPPEGLRPGEIVQVIAINRATGYMGSLDVEIQPSGTTLVPPTPIEMGPPNLKVIATREFRTLDEISGETETRINIIGSEGAGLASDNYVKIQTIWLDRDGQVLPEGLPGYTGRVAISTGSRTRDFSGNFEIKPGYQTQLVQLNNLSNPRREHFYVQVIGEPITGSPNFGSPGAGERRLRTRPKNYVPLLVPVFDEAETRLAEEALGIARLEDQADLPERVDPIYRWVYRPELQFTTYDLRRHQLELNFIDESTQLIDLVETPSSEVLESILGDNIDFIRYIADLDDPRERPLELFGPDKQFVIALGAEEIEFDFLFNTEGQLRFNNPEHINRLSPIDIASVRLYLNNDSANILWEYSAANIEMAVDLNRDGYLDFVAGEDSLLQPDQQPTDLTTPARPFRFWVNNDYDVVNNDGDEKADENCPALPLPDEDGQVRQICEVWDQDVVDGRTNTADMDMPGSGRSHRERVDNYRDLEDFIPLKMRLSTNISDRDYRLEISAEGVSVNLFRGTWNDDRELEEKAHSYIYLKSETEKQVSEANGGFRGYLGYAAPGEEALEIRSFAFKDFFDAEGVGRFIAEGVEPTDPDCADSFDNCYLSVKLFHEDKLLREARVYLDFNDVRDYYEEWRAGPVVDNGSSFRFSAAYDDSGISETNPKRIDIFDGTYTGEDSKHYALLVHGWRMRETEKEQFADTSFKRLYWTGYRGTMGALKWPTGWFFKPGHLYGNRPAVLALPNTQNYADSEEVARRVGAHLSSWYSRIPAGTKKHVFAHSMGNVVVSESLRHASTQVVDTYIAMEAAEAGGSYDSGLLDMKHKILIPGAVDCLGDRPRTAEEAWRCYNLDNLVFELFDMPPDKYRYDVPLQHGPTNADNMKNQDSVNGPRGGGAYYKGINLRAFKIVNFFNADDAALSIWEFNQLTKPEAGLTDGPEWVYDYEPITCGDSLLDPCGVDDRVEDRYFRRDVIVLPGGITIVNDDPLTYSDSTPITADTGNIIGHILPARTGSLGQVGTMNVAIVKGNIELQFTNSNQDHSAQFHGYLSEERDGVAVRLEFWQEMLGEKVINLSDADFSGLKP